MTGTGTQADPYIVDTWADFVTAVGKSDVYVECAEGTVWDMNDIAPDGINSKINIYAKSINGNGVIIKKLYFTSNASFFFANSTSVTGVDFLDSLIESGTFIYRAGAATFQECRFSGIIQDSTFFYNTANSSAYIKRSSINLQFQGNSLLCCGYYVGNGIGGRPIICENCNVRLSGNSTHSSAITSYDSNYKYNLITFENCLISGVNPFKYLYVSWAWSSGTYSSKYSVFDIVCSLGQFITNAPRYSSIVNCIINSDKLNGATVDTAIKKVTDDQLHDASYLQSIGFPIGV
jgi:hypothetical protein